MTFVCDQLVHVSTVKIIPTPSFKIAALEGYCLMQVQ